jgi:hypothetical protein
MGKTHESKAGELWRYMLFSEFAFGLPVRVRFVLDEASSVEDWVSKRCFCASRK